MSVLKMTDLDLAGKRVLIREDLNVPIKDGKVASDKRIRASLPTIEHAMNAGAKVMLMSHLGRPTEGEFAEEFSMRPVADHLSGLLGKEVKLVADYLDRNPESLEVPGREGLAGVGVVQREDAGNAYASRTLHCDGHQRARPVFGRPPPAGRCVVD